MHLDDRSADRQSQPDPFRLRGIFRLTVLLGLAMTDPLTRTVYTAVG
jgi:hypothetical protein